MSIFKMNRIGIIMEPEDGNPYELEGVLNPAAIRGPDGELYLFRRLVAKNNYSRIGIVRVIFNKSNDPVAVRRLGIAWNRKWIMRNDRMAAEVVKTRG